MPIIYQNRYSLNCYLSLIRIRILFLSLSFMVFGDGCPIQPDSNWSPIVLRNSCLNLIIHLAFPNLYEDVVYCYILFVCLCLQRPFPCCVS